MNAKQLSLNGTACDAWQCEKCKAIYRENTAYSSESCCKCRICGKVLENRGGGECDQCWRANHAKRDMERLDDAEELADYAGPVVHGGEDYYPSVSEYADMCDNGLNELPEFVHTCTIHHYHISLDDVIQSLRDEASLEDEHDFLGLKELQAAVDIFNKVNEKFEYWRENSKHKVRVPKREEKP